MIVYSSLLLLALVVSAPWWLWRMAVSGRYRAGLSQRLGFVPHSLDETIARRGAARGLVWLHAVSVGEVLAAQRLVAELQTAMPNHLLVVSTTTETGQQIAREKLGGVPVFYYPLDFRFAVRRYLRALRPTLFVTVESEFWPRMLVECDRAGIPVAVVNARISDRSFPRYLRLRKLWKPLLAKVSVFLAQGEETAERLCQIGVATDHIQVTGNLKFELPLLKENILAVRLGRMRGASRIFVAGSTLAGEEELLLTAWATMQQGAPDAVLLLAPRHPERFDEVGKLLQESAFQWQRASELPTAGSLIRGSIILLDTLGDLASIYSICSAAFVGGSLVPRGGHNPLEPARFGKPIVMGPSFENFREVIEGLKEAGAIYITQPENLAYSLMEAATNGQRTGRNASSYFEREAGATAMTIQALQNILEPHP